MAAPRDEEERDRRFWNGRVSLATRILAVNVIALGLLAGSLFYLDNYRRELLAERFRLAQAEAEVTAASLQGASRRKRRELIAQIGSSRQLRLRLYDPAGALLADSFALAGPTFTFADPEKQPWLLNAASSLDAGMDFILGAPPIPDYVEPDKSSALGWPETTQALAANATVIRQLRAPDEAPVINAAIPVGEKGEVLLTTRYAPDITQNVRDARQTLAIIVGTAFLVSILLSLFLARTIVQPLRQLVRAAIRVRLGRDREVIVPRLPDRGDEIGLLARAVSDMTAALRQRIDAVESFAADVAHELKNPLASLRSALESLGRVDDPELRRQLFAVAAHDVQRIDRLITEIAEASRIDAELSRTKFEAIDIARLVRALVAQRDARAVSGGRRISVSVPDGFAPIVAGDAERLERVLENLLDNAASFSPNHAAIDVTIAPVGDRVEIAISDHGPGIPADSREKVFERFHSLRPPGEDFGSHSGLGLAIARTIVEAHDGTLTAHDRRDGTQGARLVIDLPAWEYD